MTKSRIACEKTLFRVREMHYKVCFSLLMILPICLPMALCICTCLDSEPLRFASKSVEFFHASLYHWSLKNKVTLDLSHYVWKRLVGDICCCNFFLIVNCCRIVPEIFKMCNLWRNWLKLGRNDQITHCLWKDLVWSSGNALSGMCQLGHDFTYFPTNGSFYVYLSWFRTFAFCIEISLILGRHHCTARLLRIN